MNIYPAEIDAVLLTHPAVADVGTIGIPDDEWGESVLAVVEPKPGVDRATLPEELLAFCRERLAGFKCPRGVDLVDEPPARREREALQAAAARRLPRLDTRRVCQVKPDT